MKGRLLFQEQQSFRGSWVPWLMLAFLAGGLGILLYGFYYQIIRGQPWGDHPIPDVVLMLLLVGMIVLIAGIFWLFQVMRLVVKVDQGGLMYSFAPFDGTMKKISKEDLKELYVKSYNYKVYGDHGYSISTSGKAYTFGGKSGLQLVFSDGKKLFLGTKKPDELEAAIRKLKQNWQMQ